MSVSPGVVCVQFAFVSSFTIKIIPLYLYCTFHSKRCKTTGFTKYEKQTNAVFVQEEQNVKDNAVLLFTVNIFNEEGLCTSKGRSHYISYNIKLHVWSDATIM